MTKTTSSLKQARRWAVGITIMKANTSSMNELNACILQSNITLAINNVCNQMRDSEEKGNDKGNE